MVKMSSIYGYMFLNYSKIRNSSFEKSLIYKWISNDVKIQMYIKNWMWLSINFFLLFKVEKTKRIVLVNYQISAMEKENFINF